MDVVPSKTVRGVVDRISGSGNAMLRTSQTSHSEWNLGPLPPSTVGEVAVALTLDEPWAVCLNSRYMDGEYISSFLDKGLSLSQLSKSNALEWDDPDTKSFFSHLLMEADVYSSPPQNLSVGDEIEIELLDFDIEGEWIADFQNSVVYIEDVFATSGLTLEVVVTAIEESYIDAEIRPAIEPQTELTVGENIRIEPQAHDGEDTYAVFENIPVYIPEEKYPVGEEVVVGVEAVSSDHVAAGFSSIDDDCLPEVGATVSLNSTPKAGITFINGLRFHIESPLFDAISSRDIRVTDITDTAVEAVYDITNTESTAAGDELTVEIESVTNSQVIGRYQDVPVVVSHGGQLSDVLIGETISVQVEKVNPDRLSALLTAPDSSTVEMGEDYNITVLGRSSNYAVAIVEQTPIVVESDYLLQEEDELRIQLTEVRQGCIEGSVLPLASCPSEGETVRISAPGSTRYTLFEGIPVTVPADLSVTGEVHLGIEAVNSDSVSATVHGLPLSDLPDTEENIVASIIQTSSSGTFAVVNGIPVFLPISRMPVDADVAIRVTEVEVAYIRGFVTQVESDTGVVSLPDYQHEIQSGTRDIREESFADATSHFNTAVEISDDHSGIATVLPKYTGTLTTVITALHSDEARTAEAVVEDAIEMLPNGVEGEEEQVLVDICCLRLRVVDYLLQATQGVFTGSGTNLQHIYQESVARSPLREATQALQEAEDVARGTPYEERVPGILLQRVIWLVDEKFSSLTDDLSGWVPNSLPDVNEFAWPYQSLEKVSGLSNSAILDSEQDRGSAELSTFDIDADITGTQSSTADRSHIESNAEPGDTGGKAETGDSETGDSEVAANSAQSSDDDLAPVSTEGADNDAATAQIEVVEESLTASPSATPSSEMEKNLSTEDSTPEVVTEVEDSGVDSDLSELRAEAEKKARSNPVRDTSPEITVGSRYQRAPAIRNYALARADGICECCGNPAPFKKPDGDPYLEVHHVNELGEGGEDHPGKVVALCPVCHKRIHHGEDGTLINEQLVEKLKAGLADAGTN